MTKREAARRCLVLAHVISGALADDEGATEWVAELERIALGLAGLLPRDVQVTFTGERLP